MTHILLIIQSLAATSSRKEKQVILEANSKNAFLAKYLQVTYNPKLNFYIQAIQGTKTPQETATLDFNATFIDYVIQEIAERRRTGGDAREFVESNYAFMSPDDRQLFAWMINRDIKAGCSVSTFNKVWPNLIETVPYMRCALPKHSNPKDWFEANLDLVVYSQEKMDAMFANLTVKDGTVTLSSRTGKPFPAEAFSGILGDAVSVFQYTQLHGELIAFDATTNDFLPREKSNGYMNSLAQGGDVEPNYSPVFVAWDMIPSDVARAKGKHLTPYSYRFKSLYDSLIEMKPSGYFDEGKEVLTPECKFSFIYPVETRLLKSWQEVEAHYAEMVEQGKEGTVVKHPDMIWEDGTSDSQVKMKQESDADLKIVGFNEGSGRLESTFGSLICESADGQLSVGVSGLTDKMRQEIWDKKDEMIGKIVVIKGNKVLAPSEADGKHSIFLPRFVEVRSDKLEANTLTEIQDIFSKA